MAQAAPRSSPVHLSGATGETAERAWGWVRAEEGGVGWRSGRERKGSFFSSGEGGSRDHEAWSRMGRECCTALVCICFLVA